MIPITRVQVTVIIKDTLTGKANFLKGNYSLGNECPPAS